MKIVFFSLVFFILPYNYLFAQSTAEILEKGIVVNKNEKLFLEFFPDSELMEFQVNDWPRNPDNYADTSIFLVRKSSRLNIYMVPLNPLNYSTSTETIIIDDSNELKVNESLSLINNISNQIRRPEFATSISEINKGLVKPKNDYKIALTNFQKELKKIESSLNQDQTKKKAEAFEILKGLDFKTRSNTMEKFRQAEILFKEVKKHYEDIRKEVNALTKNYNSNEVNTFVAFSVKNIIQLIDYKEKESLTNLKKALDTVDKAIDEAGNRWLTALPQLRVAEGKISTYTFKIYSSGLELDDNSRIITSKVVEKTSRTIKAKKYRLFIPEVSNGIAYSNIGYQLFGVESDSTNQLLVTQEDESILKNINYSAMINYNLFLQESPITPFWQIGVGLNTEIPILLTGVGIRTHSNNQRLALSFGIALSFVQKLDQLSIGDMVSSTSELEDDLKYELQNPKPYFGFQLNF